MMSAVKVDQEDLEDERIVVVHTEDQLFLEEQVEEAIFPHHHLHNQPLEKMGSQKKRHKTPEEGTMKRTNCQS